MHVHSASVNFSLRRSLNEGDSSEIVIDSEESLITFCWRNKWLVGSESMMYPTMKIDDGVAVVKLQFLRPRCCST